MRPYVVEVLGTPEAGKSTSVKNVRRTLNDKGYKVGWVREAGKLVPDALKTGNAKGNVWMTMNAMQGIWEETHSDRDIVLVERGTVDASFWNHLYSSMGEFSEEECSAFEHLFKVLKAEPDCILFLTVSAEESIRRRGGEGHLVTKAFIERFNNEINKFLPTVPIKQEMLNTCGMSTSQVHDWMLETIESGYSAFKTQMMG